MMSLTPADIARLNVAANTADDAHREYLERAVERMRLRIAVAYFEPWSWNDQFARPSYGTGFVVASLFQPWTQHATAAEATHAYLDLCDKLLSSASASPAAPPGADEAGDVDPPPASPAAPMVS